LLPLAQCFSPSGCFFVPCSSHHPYMHHFHSALVLTAFIVNIMFTCCKYCS
jgi:hypothetical protein